MERRAATVWVKFVLHGLLPRLPVIFFIHTVCEWLMTMSRYWEALFVGRCVIRFCHCSLPVPLQRPEVQGVDMQLINSTRHKSHDIALAAWGNTPLDNDPRHWPTGTLRCREEGRTASIFTFILCINFGFGQRSHSIHTYIPTSPPSRLLPIKDHLCSVYELPWPARNQTFIYQNREC